MQDGATATHGEDVCGRAAPDTIQAAISRCPAAHSAPGAAVVVQDGATVTHGEDISGRAAPDTIQPSTSACPLLMVLQALPS